MTEKSSLKSLENKEKDLFQLNSQVNEKTKALKSDFQGKIQEILACEAENLPEKDLESDNFLEKYQEKVFEVDLRSSDPDLFSQLSKVKASENLAFIQEIGDLKAKNHEKETLIINQKEEIMALEVELTDFMKKIREKEGIINKMQEKGKGISEDSKKFIKEITIFNEKIEAVRREKEEVSGKFEGFKQELERTSKRKEDLMLENEGFIEDGAKKDEKIKVLERNLEENKGKIKEKRMVETEEKEVFSKENEKLMNEQKKLIACGIQEIEEIDRNPQETKNPFGNRWIFGIFRGRIH